MIEIDTVLIQVWCYKKKRCKIILTPANAFSYITLDQLFDVNHSKKHQCRSRGKGRAFIFWLFLFLCTQNTYVQTQHFRTKQTLFWHIEKIRIVCNAKFWFIHFFIFTK